MTRFLLPLVASALLISFFGLGSFTVFDVDEAVFSQASKEMLKSGNWITPTYNGENRYDKPILFYWLMGASYWIFGMNEFAARFPSAVSGCLLCLAIFFFVKHFKDERRALCVAFTIAISPYYLVYTHAAVTDMALTLFITLALLSFYLSLEHGAVSRKYLLGLYIFSALAFLTKGLIGILFPFGVACIYLLATEGIGGMKRLSSTVGVILFVIISAPWYSAQFFINGQEFVQQFFIKHHFKRYTEVISGHKGPLYYYVPALLIGLMPWVAFLPSGIRHAFRNIRLSRKGQVRSAGSDTLGLFALVWFAFIVLFFSLSTTKLPNYILPSVPAAALLIVSGMIEETRWTKYAHAGIIAMTLTAGFIFLMSGRHLTRFGISETGWTLWAALTLFALAVASVIAILIKRSLYISLYILTGLFLVLLATTALPLANHALQGTLHRYSLYAKNNLREDDNIITYGINNPSIVFYSDRRVVKVGSPEELATLLSQGRRLLLISKSADIEGLSKVGFHVLEDDGKYAMLEKK